MYVADDRVTYLMRAVQHVKMDDAPGGSELYFVVSGSRLDGLPGAITGVFQVHPNLEKENGEIIEVSQPVYAESTTAVLLGDIKFLALSGNQWGWLLKVQTGQDSKAEDVSKDNLIVAPIANQIRTLAQLPASVAYTRRVLR